MRVTQETSDICLFFAEDSAHQHSVMVLAWVTPRWRLLPVAAGIDHPVISPESSHRPTETTALLLLMLCLTFMSAITFMTMSVTSCFILVSCFPRLLDEMIGYRTFWLMGCSDISLSFVCSSPSCCSRGFEVHCISFSVIGSFTVKLILVH